jgi:hypothetical protein
MEKEVKKKFKKLWQKKKGKKNCELVQGSITRVAHK